MKNNNPLNPEKLNFNYFNFRDRTTWPTGYSHWPFFPRKKEPIKVTLGEKTEPEILKVLSVHKNQGITFEGKGFWTFNNTAWGNGYCFGKV